MRAGKGFTLFISNENMNYSIKSLEDSGVLVDELLKNETKKQEGRFLGALLAPSIVQRVIFSVVKGISGRGSRRAGRVYVDKNF